jgi:hypothetical protein
MDTKISLVFSFIAIAAAVLLFAAGTKQKLFSLKIFLNACISKGKNTIDGDDAHNQYALVS